MPIPLKIKKRWKLLNHLSQLSLKQATALAQWQGIRLFLNGVQQLDEATPKVLLNIKEQSLQQKKFLEQIKKFK